MLFASTYQKGYEALCEILVVTLAGATTTSSSQPRLYSPALFYFMTPEFSSSYHLHCSVFDSDQLRIVHA